MWRARDVTYTCSLGSARVPLAKFVMTLRKRTNPSHESIREENHKHEEENEELKEEVAHKQKALEQKQASNVNNHWPCLVAVL